MGLKRELKYYWHNRIECFVSVMFLLGSMIVVNWVFSSGTLTNLPIAVIDNDGSSVSRSYIRMLEAAPQLHVVDKLTSVDDARELLEQASIYAFVLIPKDFTKNIKSGRQANVEAWHSGQFLTISATISKSLRQVTATLSAGIEITSLTKRKDSHFAANIDFSPLQFEVHTLFNPFQNYQYFLIAGLLPAMLQVFVMLWTVFIIGREFTNNSAAQWQATAGSIYSAIATKVLPVFLFTSAIGIGCLVWLFGIAGWPINGSLALLVVGWELMIVAYIVLGLLFAAFSSRLATGLSFGVFFTAPAFAYAGITFPQHAMPLLAQLWTYMLPIRTLLRLQVEQVEMGAPIINSIPEVLILICFILLPLPFAIARIRTRCNTVALGCAS